MLTLTKEKGYAVTIILTIILSLLAVLAVGLAGWAVWDFVTKVKKGDDDEN